MRNGDLFFNAWTDSHEDLVAINNLRDNRDGNFARVEFSPKDKADLDKPEKYKLVVDEARKPDWFDEAMEVKTVDRLKSIIARMVVNDERKMLCGGAYILGSKAKIGSVKNARIVAMMGKAEAGSVSGSSQISDVWGSAKISDVRDSATISGVWGSATISDVGDSATISDVRDSAKISDVRDSATIEKDRRINKESWK